MKTERSKYLAQIIFLAAAYFAVGRVGLLLALPPGVATAVWLPSGIALAALLVWGYRVWPGIWIGSFLVNILTLYSPGDFTSVTLSMGTVIGVATGSTLQALFGAFLIRRLIPQPDPFSRVTGVFMFVLLETAVCLVAPTAGVTSMAMAGFIPWSDYSQTWLTWWLGDFVGVLVATPAILTWAHTLRRPWKLRRLLEAFAFLILLVLFSEAIFGRWLGLGSARYPISSLLIPLFMWAAFRFSQPGVTAFLMIAMIIALKGTLEGLGPFARDTLNESLLFLQGFVGVMSLTGLAMAAALTERRRAELEVIRLNDELEQRVQDRTRQLEQANQDLRNETNQRRKLEEAQSKLATIVQASDDAIISMDLEGIVRSWNPSAEKMFGYSSDEVVGRPVTSLIPSEQPDRTEFVQNVLRIIRSGGRIPPYAVEKVRRNGRQFWISISIFPIKGEADRIIGLSAIVRDITELKDAEERIRMSEEQNRLIIETAPDAFVAIDERGKIVVWNRRAETMFGWPQKEALGKTLAETIIPEKYRQRHAEGLARFHETGEGSVFNRRLEFPALHRDGHEFPIELKIAPPLKWSKGMLFTAFIRDLRDQKRIEEEQKQMNAQLLQAQKLASVGQLAAGIAHEVNNPTSFILSNLGMIREYYQDLGTLLKALCEALERIAGGEDPKSVTQEISRLREDLEESFLIKDMSKAIEESTDGARRIRDIVRNLREFVSGSEDSMAPCDINTEIDRALRMCRNELKEKKITVARNYATLPVIMCYPQRMGQVFVNLIVNAVQSIEKEGTVTLTTAIEDGEVVIRVQDTGAGILPEHLHRIFEPFFTTKPVGKGTGLGLYVAYSAVKAHGGRIEVSSEPGKGTEFTIHLPYTATDPKKDIPPAQELSLDENSTLQSQHRVIVVDDEPAVLSSFQRLLRQEPYTLMTTVDPWEALEWVRKFQVSLIIADQRMPNIRGTVLGLAAREIRPQTKIVIITGYLDDIPLVKSMLDDGIHRVISKPWDDLELKKTIRDLLRQCEDGSTSDG